MKYISIFVLLCVTIGCEPRLISQSGFNENNDSLLLNLLLNEKYDSILGIGEKYIDTDIGCSAYSMSLMKKGRHNEAARALPGFNKITFEKTNFQNKEVYIYNGSIGIPSEIGPFQSWAIFEYYRTVNDPSYRFSQYLFDIMAKSDTMNPFPYMYYTRLIYDPSSKEIEKYLNMLNRFKQKYPGFMKPYVYEMYVRFKDLNRISITLSKAAEITHYLITQNYHTEIQKDFLTTIEAFSKDSLNEKYYGPKINAYFRESLNW